MLFAHSRICAGFICTYTKTITVSFTLANVTLYDFTHDTGGVRTNFIASIAAAAGVDVASVSLLSATDAPPNARRLLQLEGGRSSTFGLSVRVHIRPPETAPDLALQRLQARPDFDDYRAVA